MSVARRSLLIARPAAGGARVIGRSDPAVAATRSEQRQRALVDPTPAGSFVPPPFLAVPFRSHDARRSIFTTNGWFVSADEYPITGEPEHKATDLELVHSPDYGWGVPVLAAAAGRAYFTYQYISGSWTNPKTGLMHHIGKGAGLMIEVRHAKDSPDRLGFVTQYAHVSRVADGLPYLPPIADQDVPGDWVPSGLFQDNDRLWNLGMPVKRGDVIGYMGDTGIGLDWRDDFDPATGQVAPRNRQALPGWDPVQLHFQLYQGRIGGSKQNIIDPWGIWGQVRPGQWSDGEAIEHNPYSPQPGVLLVGMRTAFLTDQQGRPQYAA